MKHSAGLVLALASAAPALARDPAPGPRQAGDDPTLRALAGATATDDGGAGALAEGRTHLLAGNAAQAISSFRLALSADQSSVAAYSGLGIAYDRLGRSDLARRHFETALSLDPDAADVAYNLGYSLHLAGEHRAAVPWLQRASGGSDDRAAAASRRLLAVIAARLEADAIAPVVVAPSGPARVASARIEMASIGEAVLVLPSAAKQPEFTTPVLMASAPAVAPKLALSVPVERLVTAALAVPEIDMTALTVAVPVIAAEAETETAEAPAPAAALRTAQAEPAPAARVPLFVREVMTARLGALAALTIPMAAALPALAAPMVPATEQIAPTSVIRVAARAVTRAFARPQPVQETAAELPRVITLGDTPPDFSSLLPTVSDTLEPAGQAFAAPPLRLLDLAALPLLATATPLAPLPLLAPPRIAVDWLAGTDIDHLAPEAAPPAYQRLMNALLAQADLADAVDPRAVRMAISRLEALVSRIQDFSLEVMRA